MGGSLSSSVGLTDKKTNVWMTMHRRRVAPYMEIWNRLDATQRAHDIKYVVLTSMRRDHVASTSIRRHFGTKCPLGTLQQTRAKPKSIKSLLLLTRIMKESLSYNPISAVLIRTYDKP